MDKTEINLTIAGIKYPNDFLHMPDGATVWCKGKKLDYLSPELNRGLEDELLRLGMRLQYSSFSEEYAWTKPELVYRHEDRGMASCLAYIEAMK